MTSGENTANILLQRLVREVSKLWNGEPSEIKTAWDAYELCYAIGQMTIGAALREAAKLKPGCVRVKIPEGTLPQEVDDEIKLTREDVENAEEIDLTGAECRPLTDEEMLGGFARMFPSSPEAIAWKIKRARMAREEGIAATSGEEESI